LVGQNNSGKTSVLEALQLLTTRSAANTLWELLWRRGERLPEDRSPPRQGSPELDISHLFYGHEIHIGSKFSVSARNQTPERSITFSIAELNQKERQDLFGADDGSGIATRTAIHIKGMPTPNISTIPMTARGGIFFDTLEGPRRLRRRSLDDTGQAQYISPESLSPEQLIPLWETLALTPLEGMVLRALQFLDPDIERIASQSTSPYYGALPRGGFKVKRKGLDQPIPIGSLGDGMWRMLAMAIAITQCKHGVLLVDEIDTGLHYKVMSDMWTLIFSTAKEFDVQVFATSHSLDCVQSLASICLDGGAANNQVTLQRIELGKTKAVPYSEAEIRIAAERQIEVR
jgi:hypothetical protein